jgi:sigma-B regulation protein RsbU (phosphoserine phosphatase)
MTGTELAGIFIGITLLTLGFVSTVVGTLRFRRHSATLLTFGLWSALYGARLLASQAPVRGTIGGAPGLWEHFAAIVTYTINVPIALFVGSLIGPGWRLSARWVTGVMASYAVVATTMGLASGNPKAAMTPNSWLVLAAIVVLVGNILHSVARGRRTPLTDPIVMFGGTVAVLFVVNENLGGIVAPGVNIESIGVLVFVICLGYALARSMFRAEAEFLGVQRELERAREIQFSLLPPQIPKSSGLDVAVRFVPMNAVAGDIYDVIEIGPSSIGILVADVMGHGIPAALVASMVKLAFSVQAEHARDPAKVLTSMNQILCRQLHHSYVSAVYAVVDTDQHTVTLANAGHPSPLFRRRGDAVTHVEREHGLLLGFLPDAQYTNARLESIAAGDRLLLYSDGVLEARDRAGEFFDAERVARWLVHIQPGTAERFADTALDELTRWSDRRRFDDDVTFVVAQVR